MSASSTARISSEFTSGSVLSTWIVPPSGTAGSLREPGSSARNMSFSPVRGRSSTVASRRTRPSCSRSRSSRTRARPSCSSTSPTSPTRMPATRTVCPWPGVTPWAFWSSTQTCAGPVLDEREAEALLREDVGAHANAEDEQAEHCEEVAQVGADRTPHGLIPSRLAWSLRPSPNHVNGSSAGRPLRERSTNSRSCSYARSRCARSPAVSGLSALRPHRLVGRPAGRVQVRDLLRLARHVGAERPGACVGRTGRTPSSGTSVWP